MEGLSKLTGGLSGDRLHGGHSVLGIVLCKLLAPTPSDCSTDKDMR